MRPTRRDRSDAPAAATVPAVEEASCSADSGQQAGVVTPDSIEAECRQRSDTERETFAECLRKMVQLMPQITRGMRRRQLPSGPNDSPLGPRHSVALSVLSDQGPMTVGQLAGELGLTLATVSGIVADVERAGFAQRTADPADRRRTIVALAEPHAQALGTWLDGATAPMARALDKMDPTERAVLLKAMALLDDELNGVDPSDDTSEPTNPDARGIEGAGG